MSREKKAGKSSKSKKSSKAPAKRTSKKKAKKSKKQAIPLSRTAVGEWSLQEFNNVALVYRPDTKEAFDLANRLGAWLADRNVVTHMYPHHKFGEQQKDLSEKTLDALNLVIVLGGDGTYLNAARLLDGRKVPILGVNMGSLGFLTTTKVSELFEAVIYTMEGKMELRPRTMLDVEVKTSPGSPSKRFMALNDAVVERGGFSQLISIDFYHENFLVNPIKADGIVIATPTGSTAYNLSAGGPILYPESSCFVVTPIAPHSLTNRPMIFSDQDTLNFRISNLAKGGILTVDGKQAATLNPGDEITIKKHAQFHFVVRHPTHNYFNLLREKLNFGERNQN